MMRDDLRAELITKKEIGIKDFALLSKSGMLGLYEECELTHIFLIENKQTFHHYYDLSQKIFFHFLNHVKRTEYHPHPFCFSRYYKYFLHAIYAISKKDNAQYLQKLESISISLFRCLYSWELNEKDYDFTQWIYWILAVKHFSRTDKIDQSHLPYTFKILHDERIMNLLKTKIGDTLVSFDELALFLEEPEKIDKMSLPVNDKVIELCWASSKGI
jgi:hypothetical protein